VEKRNDRKARNYLIREQAAMRRNWISLNDPPCDSSAGYVSRFHKIV